MPVEIPGRNILASFLRVSRDSSSSIMDIVLRVLFNVSSDIPVNGMGVSQPLRDSEVAVARYMALQKSV